MLLISLWRIDFSGPRGSRRLVDYGDGIDRDPTPAVKQNSSQWAEVDNPWGGATGLGGATSEVRFSVRKHHESHAALRDYCMAATASFPGGRGSGTLTLQIDGGATWRFDNCVMTTSDCSPLLQTSAFASIQSFVITGGQARPVAPIALYPGIPVDFILQPIETLTLPVESY